MFSPDQLPFPKIRLNKFWQGDRGFVVWQASPYGDLKDKLPKKFYFIADTSKNQIGFRASLEKPEGLKPSGAMVNIVRKYAAQSMGCEVFYNEESKTFTLAVIAKGKVGFFCINKSGAPFIDFIVENESFCRYGLKGCYTKKITMEKSPVVLEDLPNSLMDKILQEIHTRQAQEPSDETEETADSNESLSDEQREIRRKFARRLKTLKRSLTRRENELPSQSDIEKTQLNSSLLQSFSYKVSPGDHVLTLSSEETGLSKNLEIELDPDISIGKNINNYFLKVKKLEKAKLVGEKQVKELKNQINELQSSITAIDSGEYSFGETEALDRFNLKPKQTAKPKHHGKSEQLPFKKYVDPKGTEFHLGKGSKENDLLTKKAKSNDWWVHVTSGTGSHVIIKTQSLNGTKTPNSDQIRFAAILAIHHSKQRSDLAGEIYVTQKRHLRKPKGLPPGKWLVDKSEILFIRYDENERQFALDCLK